MTDLQKYLCPSYALDEDGEIAATHFKQTQILRGRL